MIKPRLPRALVPLVLRDVVAYARHRRRVWRDLQQRHGAVPEVRSVSLLDALRLVHEHRFPGQPAPAEWPMRFTVTEDFEALELMMLALLVQAARPETAFEIGTYEGRSANIIALHAPPDARVWTLDLPAEGATPDTGLRIEPQDVKWLAKERQRLGFRVGQLEDESVNARVTQLLGDSATFDYTPHHRRMDLVFVDGAHSLQYVLSDARNALRMASDRGVILFHDYLTHDEVTLAMTKLAARFTVRHVSGTSFALLFPPPRRTP